MHSTGVMAFCGSAVKQSGETAGFVALSDASGRPLWLIQMNPLRPRLIIFGPNNTIWTIGEEVEGGHVTLADHFVFRTISLDGHSVNSHTLRSALNLGMLQLGSSSRLGMSALVASADRVGLYIAKAHRWSEFSADGTWIGSWIIPLPTYQNNTQTIDIPMRAVVLTRDDRVLGYFSGHSRGRGMYELSRSKATWLRRDDLDPKQVLVGIEDNQLLLESSQDGNFVFKWYPLN
ncbi:MAG: hypothetical protein ACR2NN_27060 [Bryobacteraceae bacterium]